MAKEEKRIPQRKPAEPKRERRAPLREERKIERKGIGRPPTRK